MSKPNLDTPKMRVLMFLRRYPDVWFSLHDLEKRIELQKGDASHVHRLAEMGEIEKHSKINAYRVRSNKK